MFRLGVESVLLPQALPRDPISEGPLSATAKQPDGLAQQHPVLPTGSQGPSGALLKNTEIGLLSGITGLCKGNCGVRDSWTLQLTLSGLRQPRSRSKVGTGSSEPLEGQ